MLPDLQLTPNFSRYQILKGIAMPMQAIELNFKNIDEYLPLEPQYIELCTKLETVLDDLIHEFQRPMYFMITSGFRCREWELLRKRSGKSQHTIGAALDVIPFHQGAHSPAAFQYLEQKYWNNWSGGFAIKKPSIKSSGFIHFDNRNTKARWHY